MDVIGFISPILHKEGFDSAQYLLPYRLIDGGSTVSISS